MKNKEEVKNKVCMHWNSAFCKEVNVTRFILMKTVIFICMGRHEVIAHVETYRDRQGQTKTDRDIQGQTRTSRDKHGQTGTSREKQGQKGNLPVCPCLSLFIPALSLLVPACPWH